MQEALSHIRTTTGETPDDEHIARLSPLMHGHINMLGHYTFTLPEDILRRASPNIIITMKYLLNVVFYIIDLQTLYWLNDGGSHHFGAARYQARRLALRFRLPADSVATV
jgi:hypothetical protein